MNTVETRLIAALDRRRARYRPADELRRPATYEPRRPVSTREIAEAAWRAVTTINPNTETDR